MTDAVELANYYDQMRIAIGQLNPVVGDIEGNVRRLEAALREAQRLQAELLVLPELFITGYPPRDLLELPWFINKAESARADIARLSQDSGCAILVGCVVRNQNPSGRGLYNCALGFHQGKQVFCQPKLLLPFYDVFDETRYFDPGDRINLWNFGGETIGVSVCEDAWNLPELQPKYRYGLDPIAEQKRLGATLLINIAASPFWLGKPALRQQIFQEHSARCRLPLIFVNQVGANDELIFDGNSLVVDERGAVRVHLFGFREQILLIDTGALPADPTPEPEPDLELIYQALTLGIRDYFRKCGFQKAVLGLSGGIDSAVTACLAAAALGPENVIGVTMPSPFSSAGSVTDSRLLAANLGINLLTVPITAIFNQYLKDLQPVFGDRAWDETEENIQARIRGNILMAIANKFRALVLATGNKSELAVGYCTLYGDLSGSLAVIGDLPKTMVYQLARHINHKTAVIPETIISKVPSAELRPNQKDEDTLPPYPLLDRILELHIEAGLSAEEIIAQGLPADKVRWVVRQVAQMEYKRRQAPLVLRVTSRAFGSGRRFPIAARYWD